MQPESVARTDGRPVQGFIFLGNVGPAEVGTQAEEAPPETASGKPEAKPDANFNRLSNGSE